MGGTDKHGCKKNLSRKLIVVVPRASGMYMGTQRWSGSCSKQLQLHVLLRVFGWKRLGVANNGKKVTPWWNKEVKDDIREKTVAYKAWL